jgi:acetoin utilization deacetylase AcuC-like enzyme
MGETYRVFGEYQNIMTIPIPAETTWIGGYEQALMEKALPFIRTMGEWEPDLVVVCAGYDALDSDELASVSLQAIDYGRITRLLRQHLQSTAGLMLGMEGGYRIEQICGRWESGRCCGGDSQSVDGTTRLLAQSRTSIENMVFKGGWG